MAKKRTINMRHFRMNAQGVELLADVEYTVKHDGYDTSSTYKNTYDLSMTLAECAHKVLNTVIIHDQNTNIRPLTPAEGKAKIDGKVRTMKDVFPGRGVVTVKKAMTDDEVKDKARADREYRLQLIRELEEMDK